MTKKLSFNIFDHPSVKRVRVDALLLDGKMAGRIITTYPADGAGTVKCMVSIWDGPLKTEEPMRGTAGGYGYCKTSAAFADALHRAEMGLTDANNLSGRGMGAVRTWIEAHGYTFCEVL